MGSDPTLSLLRGPGAPFFSRVDFAPLSLFPSNARAGLAPPPPSHVGSSPTFMDCTVGAVPLSHGRSLARDNPRMPKACCVDLSDGSFFIYL